MRQVRILFHRGKKKNYYTVHLWDEKFGYVKIFGRFSKFSDAKRKAKRVSKKYGISKVVGVFREG
jgi:hypothetical protein